jgi:hypothetical protein
MIAGIDIAVKAPRAYLSAGSRCERNSPRLKGQQTARDVHRHFATISVWSNLQLGAMRTT